MLHHLWDGGEELLGVGVFGVVKEVFAFSVFYDGSFVHDGDVVGDVADD